MDSQDLQVLDAVRRWSAAGHTFALVTLARTWGSAPRAPGAWLALRDDGLVQGSVSGGCVEADLIERIRAGRLGGPAPTKVAYGGTPEESARFGLPCGGTLELVIEARPDVAQLIDMADRIAAGRLVRRTVDLASGHTAIDDGARGDALTWNGTRLCTLHGPRRRLLIIGAGQISYFLASMALLMDYEVTVCDPREEYADEWRVAGTTLSREMPDDVVRAMGLDPHSAVVALTHDPKLDDMALLEALKSPAFYVGAIGSRINNARRRERLARYFDLSGEELAGLHGPVGLPIGSRTPPEIAVAILAEMTAVIRGVTLVRSGTEVPLTSGVCAASLAG
ncbi:XdhC family protein [Candidatus Accumulibacter cognatus]|uniref:Xanthine dehydrogenase subunit A n=1 Tax=Candidatus Accumulibacter cognatus TaxID=2954383 RepID=A0A080M5P7_9PROT|nr:XdhC family protein [Candidatus Accumulibacter cognatus]KFB76341.1 MAG: putative xanthine dehydrogenase subunit A [Candidatus Accumulibacter cognatus]